MPDTFTWIDADGASTTLNPLFDVQGRFAPRVRLVEQGVPQQPGLRVREARHGVAEIALRLKVTAADASARRTALRDLVWAMDPTRGDGKLRVTAVSGGQREINCRVVDGLGLHETPENSTATFQRLAVVLRAHDPYWYAVSSIVDTYTTSSPTPFFPFFPLRLSGSEVFADVTVTNSGDVQTWPQWTINGPGSDVILRNLTTGKMLSISGVTIGAGETILIDTRPGAKTVQQGDGTNLFPDLTNTSSMWPLRTGGNAIRVEMGGSTSDSSVRLEYKPRYVST